ncbi:hypothetical protein GCM10020000_55350 [Streptomyces olivoverticillatus]
MAIFNGWATARLTATDSAPPKAAVIKVDATISAAVVEMVTPTVVPSSMIAAAASPDASAEAPRVKAARPMLGRDDDGVDGDRRLELVDGALDGVRELVQRGGHVVRRLCDVAQPALAAVSRVATPELFEGVDRLALVVTDERTGRVVHGGTNVLDAVGKKRAKPPRPCAACPGPHRASEGPSS